jgi:hypothetical protein
MTPDQKTALARRALEPRFLANDVARNACAIGMRRLTALVDKRLEELRGLIRADNFIDHETGELNQALTLRGATGVNAFLVIARHEQVVRGLFRGYQFLKRIAPVVVASEHPETIAALVDAIDAGCSMRGSARLSL